MSEVPMQPSTGSSVEIWSSFTDKDFTFYYALLNRNVNYRPEVWSLRVSGVYERLWVGNAAFKYASVSLSASGRTLVIAYSRSNTRDSSTPFLPYYTTIPYLLV